MPKLLQIGSSLNCGAPGKIAEQIGLLAMTRGWDVYMAHGVRHSNPSQLKTIPMVTPHEERVHALYSMLFDRHGLGPDGKTKELVAWIKDNRPDIIHLHNIHGYFLNYETLFSYLISTNIPIVWTFHDFWPITGHCAHFDYNECNKWKTLCYDCKFHKEYPFSLIDQARRNYTLKKEKFTHLENVVLVPVSRWVGSLLSQSFLKEYPIHLIYNGVDTKVFRPITSDVRSRLGLDGKFVLIGVASPWSLMKGWDDYMNLRQKLPDEYTIVMVGLSKKQKEKLPQGIVGIERTQNQEELAAYYSMADVTLNLSYQETFGMTTVEGMACGTPGIVYNKTASPELVTAETGSIVEAGNINHVVNAIIEIKNKGKVSYSAACRQRAEKNFDKDKCFKEYIRLYESLINRQNGSE